MSRQWFRVQAKADDPTVADIHIVDFIGDWIDDYYGYGVTARTFVEQLAQLSDSVKTIRVHINSPGGDVFGAVNIANALREQQASKGRTVETIVDGLAASAATIIMMAGSTVRVADNALVMVHNPWSIGIGNSADMRKLADDLDTVRNTIIATYKWHSALTEEALGALMDAETWMDADEALANGFATEKVEGLKAAASLDPKALDKLTVPDRFRDRVKAFLKPAPTPAPEPVVATAEDIIRACTDAGLDLAFAATLTGAKLTPDQVAARVASEKQARAQAQARADEIAALCTKAKLPTLAKGYIAGQMAVDDVRAHLTTITAAKDSVEIDGSLPPDQGTATRAQIDVAAVYAARNRQLATKE